uniref:Uncharacterized protein n=1 Tax=Anopheles minimus TaxID=112268 RepID=A0A182W027_9DIPT
MLAVFPTQFHLGQSGNRKRNSAPHYATGGYFLAVRRRYNILRKRASGGKKHFNTNSDALRCSREKLRFHLASITTPEYEGRFRAGLHKTSSGERVKLLARCSLDVDERDNLVYISIDHIFFVRNQLARVCCLPISWHTVSKSSMLKKLSPPVDVMRVESGGANAV